MPPDLSNEMISALRTANGRELEVVDPTTQRVYMLVEAGLYQRAMEALRLQQDREAIAQGLSELETGDGIPIEEARLQTRARLLARES